ncbi:hypothetical protein DL96DRAFT_1670496 [Flagelloscypha sp. PMI_526]|nr:hypothetical protein DL96DRAFT_1670496 [Flagelloscypha sp. PMI_526]
MADINTRPFSKNYSGLINQSVIALAIATLAVTGQELMKRRRRSGKHFSEPGLGRRESWEFGYLYQGRSWAKIPSPPSPRGWPLSWVHQVVWISETEMNRLRGVDASLYIRFLRGCFYFAILHTFSTFLVLFPLHVELSEDSVSQKSMTRASITSLVASNDGKHLLWVHIILLFWVTLTWIGTLIWVSNGAFRFRAQQLDFKAEYLASDKDKNVWHPHPHPQYGFTETPDAASYQTQPGLPLRTVMVSNVPPALRSEASLQEYFEFYMTRHLDKPAIGISHSTQPGFLNKSFAFLFNRAKRLPATIEAQMREGTSASVDHPTSVIHPENKPMIERVVIARKMTELADLLERREEALKQLETAHLKLAQRTVLAVKSAMAKKNAGKPVIQSPTRTAAVAAAKSKSHEEGVEEDGCHMTEQERMEQLIEVVGPFVEAFSLAADSKGPIRNVAGGPKSKRDFRKLRQEGSEDKDQDPNDASSPTLKHTVNGKTIWEALLAVPRSSLDPYQPLIRLSTLFRGKTVPTIDYYTRKLAVLNNSITENRAKAVTNYSPVSTAFVSFSRAEDARKACKYLAVHPDNPLACMVQMAPQYSDLDWIRVMKSSYNTEFLKDWVVTAGVWAFTLFWLFPVSFMVGLVSIQSLSIFIPPLGAYLDQHPWEQEVIQSFLPTLLVALLAILIPMLLLLIAKKAHTITTLSSLHDLIMTRYYKFLIINVLVFFCVGTAALQSVLQSFKQNAGKFDIIKIVADSFPVAGPFYVGWLIFTTAMHGGFEIALFGLPLLVYPATSSQVTPRKRAVGVRPRTLNYYYWLPNHVLVIHVLMLFSVLNPMVLPFGAFYYFIQIGVLKNQLIHVYAKNYEMNGKILLIRITSMTRMCRAQFERDDIAEAALYSSSEDANQRRSSNAQQEDGLLGTVRPHPSLLRMRVPTWINFDSIRVRTVKKRNNPLRRNPIPFPSEKEFSGPESPVTDKSGTEDVSPIVENRRRTHPPKLPLEGPARRVITSFSSETPAVLPHPSLPAWDDQTTADLPYDNPYYTRAISHELWLPRNPFGFLDLDDTISLKVSIAVDSKSQELGTWLGVPITASPPEMDGSSQSALRHEIPTTPPSELSPSSSSLPQIVEPESSAPANMPKNMALTAATPPRRPTARKSSASSIGMQRLFSEGSQHPGSPGARPQYRSFSQGSGMPASLMGRSSMSTIKSPGLNPALQPDIHAQGEMVQGYNLSRASGSRLSVPAASRAQNISTSEAIAHEVMAEEAENFNSRVEEEEQEARKAMNSRSWLTSWLYKKR